jgi:hypothetical protein
VIVQIRLPNMQVRAATYAIRYAIAREKQLGGGGAIADEKTNLSTFSRMTDGTTDGKGARA